MRAARVLGLLCWCVSAWCGPACGWGAGDDPSPGAWPWDVCCEQSYDPGLRIESGSSPGRLALREAGELTTDLVLFLHGREDEPYFLDRSGKGVWTPRPGQDVYPIPVGSLIRLSAYDSKRGLSADYHWFAYLETRPRLRSCGEDEARLPCPPGYEREEDRCVAIDSGGGGEPSCEWDPGLRMGLFSSEWLLEVEEHAWQASVASMELFVSAPGGEMAYQMKPTAWGTWYAADGQKAYPIPAGSLIRIVAHLKGDGLFAEYDWFPYLLEPLPKPSCKCAPMCDGTHCMEDGCGGSCACEAGTVCRAGSCIVPSADDGLRVLFIGNSFTHMGPVPDCFRDLAVDAGRATPDVWYATGGGATLAEHRESVEVTLRLVDEGGWDVVVLQEHSLRPTINAGDPGGFKADAAWLHDRIKAESPQALVVLYQTWARHPSNEIYPHVFRDFDEMHSQLRFHYRDAAQRYIPAHSDRPGGGAAVVAPVGDAWANHLENGSAPVSLYNEHGYHAGPYGQYLNALVIFKTVYGERHTVGLTNRCGWYSGDTLEEGRIRALQQDVDRLLHGDGQ